MDKYLLVVTTYSMGELINTENIQFRTYRELINHLGENEFGDVGDVVKLTHIFVNMEK